MVSQLTSHSTWGFWRRGAVLLPSALRCLVHKQHLLWQFASWLVKTMLCQDRIVITEAESTLLFTFTCTLAHLLHGKCSPAWVNGLTQWYTEYPPCIRLLSRWWRHRVKSSCIGEAAVICGRKQPMWGLWMSLSFSTCQIHYAYLKKSK